MLSRKQKKNLAANGPRVVGAGTKGFWPKWADFIQSGPVLPAVIALIIIGIMAMPFFSLRLGNSDQGNDPTGTTTRQAYDLLSAGFGPGFNGPLQLVAAENGPIDTATLDKLAAEVRDPAQRGRRGPARWSCPPRRPAGGADQRLPRPRRPSRRPPPT